MSYTIEFSNASIEVDTEYELAFVVSLLGIKTIPRETLDRIKMWEMARKL